ncbi:MAG: sigma-54-dependent transcriptional regulator, partial [Acidobacteriota bacterium]
ILVVDDEPQIRLAMRRVLEREGYQVETAADGAKGWEAVLKGTFDVVITDVRMPRLDGGAFLRRIRRDGGGPAVIVVSAFGTLEQAVCLVRDGADDYLLKPFPPAALAAAVKGALGRRASPRAVREGRGEIGGGRASQPPAAGLDKVGSVDGTRIQTISPKMRELLGTARRAAMVNATILIQAESGTGKELLAHFIHDASPRCKGPFLAVNVAALPGQLLESEMFGHVRGAFTGAEKDRRGWFELAGGGSLLLDEVGEMPAELQVKLLRVLQERTVVPVGAEVPRPVKIRLMAATHRDLAAEVAAGRFREDLFYRLHVIPLRIPPLRERREDIVLLARHFAQVHGAAGLTPAALNRLKSYDWPGNVRELENTVQRAAVLGGGRQLTDEDFSALGSLVMLEPRQSHAATLSVGTTIDDAEKILIEKTLAAVGGNRTRAAGVLGISVRTLRNKLRAYAGLTTA